MTSVRGYPQVSSAVGTGIDRDEWVRGGVGVLDPLLPITLSALKRTVRQRLPEEAKQVASDGVNHVEHCGKPHQGPARLSGPVLVNAQRPVTAAC